MVSFLLEIITPERKAYEEEVDEVSVPTPDGTIGVLPHHEPLFSSLSDGEIKITKDKREYFLAIGGGFMEVTGTNVSILVSRAVAADELNEAELKKAEAAAKDILANKVKGTEYATAQAIFRRSLLELKVLRRHKTHHSSSIGIH
ncbi:ATP synthase F1 subunit epsilon [Candidatus Gottesmanbacteria bacterium]|nr:ATP synthase F1 subunit epsilon [Candidatus Gottesmanbacteria bacterium]